MTRAAPRIARLPRVLAAGGAVALLTAAPATTSGAPPSPVVRADTGRAADTAGRAKAVDPRVAQPERPTVATHAGTVAPGWIEVETGGTRSASHGVAQIQMPTETKIGLASHVQLAVFTPVVATLGPRDRVAGLGDITAALKWRVLDDAPVIGDFAVLPALTLPTGSVSRGTGTGTTDVGLVLVSSHEFGRLSLDVNAGVTRRSGSGATVPVTSWLWTASTGTRLWGRLSWVGEIYGYPGTTGPRGAAPIIALLTGPTWTVRDWLVLDAGVSPTVRGPQPPYVYAGLTWNIGRL